MQPASTCRQAFRQTRRHACSSSVRARLAARSRTTGPLAAVAVDEERERRRLPRARALPPERPAEYLPPSVTPFAQEYGERWAPQHVGVPPMVTTTSSVCNTQALHVV